MKAWLIRRGILEVQRADYMWRRGREAILTLGPFGFYVNTADARSVAFDIEVGPIGIGWSIDGRDARDGTR